jgi:hypothetical protein
VAAVIRQGATALSGSVNPQGLATTGHFELGLDAFFRAAHDRITYDQRTPNQQVGSDFSAHPILATVSRLVPNALYHVRLVATNGAGTTYGPDQTFTTAKDPPPPPPALGKTENAAPVSGVVFLVIGGVPVPLTEARQLPSGSEIDSRRGSLMITASVGGRKTETGTFGGAIFKLTQAGIGPKKGLTTLSLLEGLLPGAPSYSSCQVKRMTDVMVPDAQAALSSRLLQTLRASAHGRFRTAGRYSAATVRGTAWSMSDRCDGTLTVVHRGTVLVTDFRRKVTIAVHAGRSYLAKAR